jgi:hypothetical protein
LAAIVTAAGAASLTVVLDFEKPLSAQSQGEMKSEFENILKPSGLAIDYKTRREAELVESENLVLIRFTGHCAFQPTSAVPERGALGFSYIVDGGVQPFGEIDCDRVAGVLNSAISANDYLRSDQLLGRALGRILAHEVVHMLSSSAAHAHDGVAYKELSGRMLIAPVLRLQARDFSRIRLKK